jgi:hypothetical protein
VFIQYVREVAGGERAAEEREGSGAILAVSAHTECFEKEFHLDEKPGLDGLLVQQKRFSAAASRRAK